MSDSIKCPGCGGEEFEIHKYGAMWRDGDFVSVDPNKRFYTCTGCGYIIRSAEDLNMFTVKVYIVGNSLAKQRHGLLAFEDLAGIELDKPPAALKLAENGYLDTQSDMTGTPWIFTVNAWKEFKANPAFVLCDESHTIEEVSLV